MISPAGAFALSAALAMSLNAAGGAAFARPVLAARMCGAASGALPVPGGKQPPGDECPGACHVACTRTLRGPGCDDEDAG